MLILVVYYVIIAFLINMNVIADPASVPTKNGSSSIIVLNACSRDPPCLVSCIIGFEDVKLYRSPILASAEKSYFPYANTTGLRVTIYKHIDVQDPGTIIITKKLGDDEDTCFVVRGDYSTPIISKCSSANPGLKTPRTCYLKVKNIANPSFIVQMVFFEGAKATKSFEVYGAQTQSNDYRVGTPGFLSFTVKKRESSTSTYVTIKDRVPIDYCDDTCLEVRGNYTNPVIISVPCRNLLIN